MDSVSLRTSAEVRPANCALMTSEKDVDCIDGAGDGARDGAGVGACDGEVVGACMGACVGFFVVGGLVVGVTVGTPGVDEGCAVRAIVGGGAVGARVVGGDVGVCVGGAAEATKVTRGEKYTFALDPDKAQDTCAVTSPEDGRIQLAV